MEVTFDINEDVVNDFEEVVQELDERYPDEPFDKDAFIQAKIETFVKKQREFLGMAKYNEAT